MSNKPNIGGKIVLEGEKEYRRALSDINKSMSSMRSEMKLNSSQFKDNKNSMEALSAKNDILSREYDEQKKKVATLTGALDAVKTKYGENSNEVKAWQTKLNYAQAGLFDLDQELKTNEKYLDEAKQSTNGTASSIDKFGKEVKEAEGKTSTFGDVLKANLASQAIITGVKTLTDSVKNFSVGLVGLATNTAAYADDVLTLNAQTGISIEKLQEYKYAADLVDVSVDTMTGSMAKQIKSMSNAQKGTEDYTRAYKRLGVEFEDGNGNLRDSQEVYWELIDALGKVANETERDTLAMQIFGKSAQDINPLILKGSAGMKELGKEAHKVGAVLDDETIGKLGETDDSLQRMNQSIEAAKRKFGAEMAPAVARAADKISEKANALGSAFANVAGKALDRVVDTLLWIVDHGAEVISVLAGIGTALVMYKAVSGITAVISAMKTLRTATESAAVAQGLLNTAQSLNPYGLLAAAIGGVTIAVGAYVLSMDNAEDAHMEFMNRMQDSIDEANEFKKELESAKKTHEDNVGMVEAEAKVFQNLVDELYGLESQNNKTNAEQQRMVTIVGQLNQQYPELNLQIDKSTGKLNLQKAAVMNVVDAMKQQALIEVYNDEYQERLKKNIERTREYTKANDDLEASKEKLKATETEEETARNALDEATKNNAASVDDLAIKYTEVKDRLNETAEENNKAKETYDATKDALDESSRSLSELDEEMIKIAESQGLATESSEKFNDTMEESAESVTDSFSEIQKAYDETYEAAKQSLISQTNLFDEFTQNTELSGKDLQKNLESQIKGITSWKDNIVALSKRTSTDFVKYLADLGIGASGEIQALADMSDEELEKYEETWRKYNKAIEDGAVESATRTKEDLVAEQKKMNENTSSFKALQEENFKKAAQDAMINFGAGLDDKQRTLTGHYQSIVKLTNDELKKVDGNKIGGDYVGGVIQGINTRSGQLYLSARRLMAQMIAESKKAIDSNSPSKVSEKEIGYNWVDGAVVGINKNLDKVKGAASNLRTALTGESRTNLAKAQEANTGIDYTRLARAMAAEFEHMTVEVNGQSLGSIIDTRYRRAWV